MMTRLSFAPLLPPALLWVLALAGLAFGLFYWYRGGPARLIRLGACALILLALVNPSIVQEERTLLPDIATILIDRSDSMRLGERSETAEKIARSIAARLKTDPSLEVRIRDVAQGTNGTEMFGALAETISDTSRNRLAGTILITDGQVRDAPRPSGKDSKNGGAFGPVSAVIVGKPSARDRSIRLITAPRFMIAGDKSQLSVQVDDSAGRGLAATVIVRVDGGAAQQYSVTTGRTERLPFTLTKRGSHLIEIETPQQNGELTGLNNRVYAEVSVMRDRLRVLLVTGEPHAGARVWRDFLKSDPAVDLVQFTILRPPEKEDGTPTEDLALIPFPVDALFSDKLPSFDLVIFDRYKDLGILPAFYFQNLADYVRNGGALLVVGGPPDATERSLYRTPLSNILPGSPTGALTKSAFRPMPTDLGRRHPVVAPLAPKSVEWGRWLNSVGSKSSASGQTLLQGPGGPLLVLGRVGQGRTGQLFSDQMWLWARGYDGGGPHGELLRRMAHWLMKEPDLEEERLTAKIESGVLSIERRSLAKTVSAASLKSPSGTVSTISLSETTPGLFAAKVSAAEQGIYSVSQNALTTLAASGPLNPAEWTDVKPTIDRLLPITKATKGSAIMAGEGATAKIPPIKRVAPGETAGAGVIPLTANKSYAVSSAKSAPVLPAWLAVAAILALLIMAWRREAR